MRAAAAGDLDVGRIQRGGAGVHGDVGLGVAVVGDDRDRVRRIQALVVRDRRGVQQQVRLLHFVSFWLASGWTRGARENLPPGISRKSRVKLP